MLKCPRNGIVRFPLPQMLSKAFQFMYGKISHSPLPISLFNPTANPLAFLLIIGIKDFKTLGLNAGFTSLRYGFQTELAAMVKRHYFNQLFTGFFLYYLNMIIFIGSFISWNFHILFHYINSRKKIFLPTSCSENSSWKRKKVEYKWFIQTII